MVVTFAVSKYPWVRAAGHLFEPLQLIILEYIVDRTSDIIMNYHRRYFI